MNDDEYIKTVTEAREQAADHFSSKNKEERERWVAETFLVTMNVPYRKDDIVSSKDDPPDVCALGADFEIKEILDPGRKRHKEFKDALERAKNAETASDLLTEVTPVDSSLDEIYVRCLEEARSLQKKYPETVRSTLDLLFYVNIAGLFIIETDAYPNVSELRSFGWRSVSFVEGKIASCFCAAAESPSWLKERCGRVLGAKRNGEKEPGSII